VTVKEKDHRLEDRVKEVMLAANVEQRWYLVSIVIGIFLCIVFSVANVLEGYKVSPFKSAFVGVLIFSSVGVLSYLSKLFAVLSSNIIWKSIFSAVFLALTTIALTFADGIINENFRVASEPFSYTKTLLAISMVPWFIAAFAFLLAILGISSLSFYPVVKAAAIFGLSPVTSDLKIWVKGTEIYRYVIVVCLGVFAEKSFSYSDGYFRYMGELAKEYAFFYEMDKFTHCEIKNNGERFSYLEPNVVIVGVKTNGEIVFSARACKESVVAGAAGALDNTVKRIGKGVGEIFK